ncbi:ribosome maturation factor RimP [Lactovum miscens]|uniref:Ribosome maturation factor RimP n=1 Tax=Lactovum miscens TaxID=190387 RepID=A0A841C3Z9_9LACT|nr:ribosome maturation factor RimP [Lactovum miscens]MBB5888666.1 ribosome maturation factor RimP [Lactovum miscens]
MSEIPKIVEAFILPHLTAPYELVDVEWEKMGGDMILSILVDKETGGVSIDETAELSEIISPLLDTIKPDPFPKEGYLLEVASPGVERPLKKAEHFEKSIGENVFVSTYHKIESEKEFIGELLKFEDGVLTVNVAVKNNKTKQIEIPMSAIAKAQTMVKF